MGLGALLSLGWAVLRSRAVAAAGAVFPLIKAVPLKAWLILSGAAVAGVTLLWFAHHERDIGRAESAATNASKDMLIGTLSAQLIEAQGANGSNQGAIKRLQLANAECEAGREVDRAAQASATHDHNAAVLELQRQAAQARARLQQQLNGECKAWAAQPACGAEP